MKCTIVNANGLRLAKITNMVMNIGVVSTGALRLTRAPAVPGAACTVVATNALRLTLQT